jgi:hypothetical protein
MKGMELQKVYEKEDYGMGYGHTRVGLRIDNRVIWFAFTDSPSSQEEFNKMELLVQEIIDKCF